MLRYCYFFIVVVVVIVVVVIIAFVVSAPVVFVIVPRKFSFKLKVHVKIGSVIDENHHQNLPERKR